jgi:dihydroflavonol-4-reductase
MKILLIGATAQIGYSLVPALTAAGHALTVLTRTHSRLAFAAPVRQLRESEFTPAVFEQALQGVDVAVYCVGLPEQFTFDARVFEQVNLGLFKTFTQALQASRVRRLLYISTYEVFTAQRGQIRETHAQSNPSTQSPYFSAMTRAYQHALAFAQNAGVALTTIHPAAVYGGLNTGDGFTNVLENLIHWRLWKLPVVLPGQFPLVHAHSLARAITSALEHEGAFLVSDGMSSLPQLARALREHTRSYVPPPIPAALAYAGVAPLEQLARWLRFRPMLCKAQLDFITMGVEPVNERARSTLDWQPMPLSEGLQQYLRERSQLLAAKAK